MNLAEDVKDLSDADIGKLVHKIGKWKDSKKKLIELGRDLDELTIHYKLSQDRMENYKAVLEEVCNNVKTAVTSIETEETLRKLYTLDPGKIETCKLPSFSGTPKEDFIKFQRKVNDCFQKNRTSKTDQLDKLREVLKGQAKLLVPETTEDIDKGWEILEKHYADRSNTTKARKDSLLSIGKLPSDSGKANSDMKQVEWYINLHHMIGDIIELGGRNSEMEREAFSQSTITTILNLFPSSIMAKLLKVGGEGKAKLEAIREKIDEYRETAQNVSKVKGLSYANPKGEDPKPPKKVDIKLVKLPKMTLYARPKKLNDCRICKELEAKGDTADLYENHLGNYPTGCPRYIRMSVEERSEIAKAAKFCLKCHDPVYVYKSLSQALRDH